MAKVPLPPSTPTVPTRDQVQEAIRNLFEESERFHNVTFAHPQGEPLKIFLIVDSWEARGEFNDALNEKLNEVTGGLWARARPIYQAAHDAEFANDREQRPDAHPSNCGRTGGPFASLCTRNGELSVENIGQVPCMVPEGLVDIDRADDYDVECGFSDQHGTCDDCNCVLDTDESPRDYFEDESGNMLCRDCMDKDDYLEQKLNTAGIVNEAVLSEAALTELGFTRIETHKDQWGATYLTYETGLHEGQDDDISKVVEALNKEKIDCIFTADVRQFDVEYTPWVRGEDPDEDSLEAENFRALCVRCGETGQAHTVHTPAHEFLPNVSKRAFTILESANVKMKHSPHDSAKAALQSLSKPFASIEIQKDGSATVEESSTLREYLEKKQ